MTEYRGLKIRTGLWGGISNYSDPYVRNPKGSLFWVQRGVGLSWCRECWVARLTTPLMMTPTSEHPTRACGVQHLRAWKMHHVALGLVACAEKKAPRANYDLLLLLVC